KPTFGESSASTPNIAPPAISEPMLSDRRGPCTPVQRPAIQPPTMIAAAIATNCSAIRQPEKPATICRYSAVKKKTANSPKLVAERRGAGAVRGGVGKTARLGAGAALGRPIGTNAATATAETAKRPTIHHVP